MSKKLLAGVVVPTAVSLVCVMLATCVFAEDSAKPSPLPAPSKKGKMSLEEALAKRRSIRQFTDQALTRQQIAQLCWAAQGISEPTRGFRTCPSAGALYPLELYVVTADGVEHYLPRQHAMEKLREGDLRRKLQAAALNQPSVGRAPATFVITGVVGRTAAKYGPRAQRYVLIEAGHAAQNILLQATAMGLGAVPVGAMVEKQLTRILALPANHNPMYLIPVGVPKG